jgi:hypothetical protein
MATLQEWANERYGFKPISPRNTPVVTVCPELKLLLPTGNMNVSRECCSVDNGELHVIIGRGEIISLDWALLPDGATLFVKHGTF